MSEDRWMNYREAAAALNMTPESLRGRARRERWRKQLGNDGKALVLVPADAARITAAAQEGDPPAARPVKRVEPDLGSVARIAELEAFLAALNTELDHQHGCQLAARCTERKSGGRAEETGAS